MGDCGECGAYSICECFGPLDDRCMFELQDNPRDRVLHDEVIAVYTEEDFASDENRTEDAAGAA